MADRAVALWLTDRLDAEMHIDLEELARRFSASGEAGQPWPLRRRILLFVTSPDWLSSRFLDEDYDAQEAACRNAAAAAEPAGPTTGRMGTLSDLPGDALFLGA